MHNGLHTGQDIYTLDGDRLGEVKELQGDYFKVDAPMKPDYWLRCDCLSTGAAGERAVVAFNKDRLDDYKLSEPAGVR